MSVKNRLGLGLDRKVRYAMVATPNGRHAEFILPALQAGIPVLTKKPLEVSTSKCREIIEAVRQSSAKLMGIIDW